MSDNMSYVVKQILKLYILETLPFVNEKRDYTSITVHVVFIPKKESPITPRGVRCYGVVNYYSKGRKLEEMMLTSELEMPILDYVDDKPSFYSFVEKTIMDVADEKYKDLS